MFDFRVEAKYFEDKAKSLDWVVSAEVDVSEEMDAWAIVAKLVGRGPTNAYAAIEWVNDIVRKFSDGRATVIRVLPECDVRRDVAMAAWEVCSYVRMYVKDCPGQIALANLNYDIPNQLALWANV